MSKELQKAREYEAEMEKKIPQRTRPAFHMTPATGWMNDPNGFSIYRGEYHLFYQYHPYDVHRGPMHWGHCKSKDLVKWERMPCALAPDTEYDGQGCFSGTALEYGGKHILLYTSVMEELSKGQPHRLLQNQSMAAGDGEEYEKLENNPVITGDMLPEGYSPLDFRDPKFWMEGGHFFAVVGCQLEKGDGDGQLALFSSPDAQCWKFEKILDQSGGKCGKMWECPDFFPLGNEQILIVSPQFMEEDGLEFVKGSNSVYFTGTFDKDRLEWHRGQPRRIDYGMDFYAPQTIGTEDGRRILIGWMQDAENYLTPEGMLWSGIMTIPRELSLKGGRLMQVPVRELENYRGRRVCFTDVALSGADGERRLDGIRGRSFDMTVEIMGENYNSFTLWLAADDIRKTALRYERKDGIFTIDRKLGGMPKDRVPKRSMHVGHREGKIKIRVLMDKFSAEVFVDDGLYAMSALIYTPLDADEVFFSCEGELAFSVEKYAMPE